MGPRRALRLQRCASQSSFGKTTYANPSAVNAHHTLPSFPGDIKGELNLKVVVVTSHFLDFEHLIERSYICLFLVACIISEPPPLPDLALYMLLRTAPTKSLPSPRSRHRSLSVRSGGSKSSIPTKNYIPSLATSLEVTLEDIDTRQAGKLFLRNPSLLRDGLSNGTFRLWTMAPSRTYK